MNYLSVRHHQAWLTKGQYMTNIQIRQYPNFPTPVLLARWRTIHNSTTVLYNLDPCTLLTFHVSFYFYRCTYVSCYHHYQTEQRVPTLTVLQCIDLRSCCASCHPHSCLHFLYIAPIAVTFFWNFVTLSLWTYHLPEQHSLTLFGSPIIISTHSFSSPFTLQETGYPHLTL